MSEPPKSLPRRRWQWTLRVGRRALTITYARTPATGRMQFTLRTALTAILIIALGLSFWIAKHQFEEIRSFHSRLRDDFAEIAIDDANRNKLHTKSAPTDQLGKWHLFVPEGRQFRLNVYSGEIPATGELDPSDKNYSARNLAYVDLSPGDHDFTLALMRNKEEPDKWLLFGRMERLQMLTMPSQELQKSLNTFDYDLKQSRETATQIAEPGQDVELLRCRFFARRDDETGDKTGPGDGILVWISELPQGKNP